MIFYHPRQKISIEQEARIDFRFYNPGIPYFTKRFCLHRAPISHD